MVGQVGEPGVLGPSGQTLPAVTAKQRTDPGWAWAPYEPDAQRPWTLALAAHLYRRAGFGAGWGQLQRALSDGPQRTVDKLLRPEADVEAFNRAYDAHEGVPPARSTGCGPGGCAG